MIINGLTIFFKLKTDYIRNFNSSDYVFNEDFFNFKINSSEALNTFQYKGFLTLIYKVLNVFIQFKF